MKAILKELIDNSPHPQCIIYNDAIILRNDLFNELANLKEFTGELPLSSILIYQSMDEWTIEANACMSHLTINRAILDQEYMLYTFDGKRNKKEGKLVNQENSNRTLRWLTDSDGIIIESSKSGSAFLKVQDCIWEFIPRDMIAPRKKKQIISFLYHHVQYEVRVINYDMYCLFEVIRAEQRIEQFMCANELFDVLELAEDSYVIHDTLTIHYANPAAHRYLGVEKSLSGKFLRNYLVDGELRKLKRKNVKQFNKKDNVLYQAIKIMTEGGQIIYTMCAIRPIEFNHKKLFISILKQPYNQPKRRQEAMQVASRLSASMAHEIRNPLTTIKGFMQLYEESYVLPKSQLTLINDELERMENIIDDYVFLAEEKGKMKSKAINMKHYLEHFLEKEKIKKVATNNPISLSVPANVVIRGYKKELGILFYNLIENAVDASTYKSPIQLRACIEDEQLCIQVIDKGTGISTDRMHLLGQPFFSSKEKGTGLGLMICYKIAELHGGNVIIKTKTGTGTIVQVHFPLFKEKYEKKKKKHKKEVELI